LETYQILIGDTYQIPVGDTYQILVAEANSRHGQSCVTWGRSIKAQGLPAQRHEIMDPTAFDSMFRTQEMPSRDILFGIDFPLPPAYTFQGSDDHLQMDIWTSEFAYPCIIVITN
jgi:hypothetical protein